MISLYVPFRMNTDPFTQFCQSRLGIIGDWHSPIMAAFWGCLQNAVTAITGTDSPGRDARLLFYFHATLIWTGIFLCLRSTFWRTSKPFWCFGLTIVLLLWLCTDLCFFLIPHNTGKDEGFLGAYLVAVGCCLNPPKKTMAKFVVGIVVVLFLFYGTALRHNALFAPMPLCVWLMVILFPAQKMRFFVPVGLVLWVAIVCSIHYVNYNVIKAVRLYSITEMFYSDIWHLNARTPRYVVPPDTFGNEFMFTEEEFREKFNPGELFLRPAFEKITETLPPEKQILMDRSTFVIYHADKDIASNLVETLMLETRYSQRNARLILIPLAQTESYHRDYLELRDAWVKRVTMDMFAYCKFKTQNLFRLCRMYRWFGSINAITVLPPLLLMAVILILSGHVVPSSKYFPCAILVCSALLYLAPLWFCLPALVPRYLYWFFAASFIAIAYFCSQSPLFHEIVQTIHRYLEKKAAPQSDIPLRHYVERMSTKIAINNTHDTHDREQANRSS